MTPCARIYRARSGASQRQQNIGVTLSKSLKKILHPANRPQAALTQSKLGKISTKSARKSYPLSLLPLTSHLGMKGRLSYWGTIQITLLTLPQHELGKQGTTPPRRLKSKWRSMLNRLGPSNYAKARQHPHRQKTPNNQRLSQK